MMETIIKKYFFLVLAFNLSASVCAYDWTNTIHSWKQWATSYWQKLFPSYQTELSHESTQQEGPCSNFDTWNVACSQLPHFSRKSKNPYKTPLNDSVFEQEIDKFLITIKQQIN